DAASHGQDECAAWRCTEINGCGGVVSTRAAGSAVELECAAGAVHLSGVVQIHVDRRSPGTGGSVDRSVVVERARAVERKQAVIGLKIYDAVVVPGRVGAELDADAACFGDASGGGERAAEKIAALDTAAVVHDDVAVLPDAGKELGVGAVPR